MNKEQAIQAAADYADRVHNGWTSEAYQKSILALVSLKNRGINQFQICDLRETIRVYFTLPEPPTKRSWGYIARMLVKDNKIKVVGYKPTNNVTAHNAIAAIYEH